MKKPMPFEPGWYLNEMEKMRSKREDLTLNYKPAGPGMGFTRCCADCSKNRIALGGRTCKRTKRWRCAECVLKRVEDSNA